jgi:CRP/FNR family transcriptional regulator, cyclic AMP receptor protein
MPATPSIASVLQQTALFAPLDQAELATLASRIVTRSFSPGQMLFTEGEPCLGLFIVARGRVRIFKTSPSGREQVLAVEGSGTSIAEIPVFDGAAYPASAAALDPSELLFISRRDFRALCLEHPEIALKVLEVVGARLRRLVGIIEELSFSTVRHRLIAWLLRQASPDGRPPPAGAKFTLGLSHQELAAQIGTVRELVSRNLARLQAQGFVEVSGHEITIRDPGGLEADLSAGV